MSRDDPDYLERRAEAQLELAQSATDPRAVRAHYELANSYLDRLYGEADEIVAPAAPTGTACAG